MNDIITTPNCSHAIDLTPVMYVMTVHVHFTVLVQLVMASDIKCHVETDTVVSGLPVQEQVVHVMPGRLSRKRLGKLHG